MAEDQESGPQRPDVDRNPLSPAEVTPGGKRRRSKGKRILLWSLAGLGVLVVAFGALVAVGIHHDVQQDNAAQPGQCVDLPGAGSSMGLKVVDCGAPAASYLVAARSPSTTGTCPTGDYLKYAQSARFGGNFTLCLAYNWKSGDCFTDNVNADTGAQRIDCTLGTGQNRYKVTQIIAGTTDKTKCATANYGVSYSQPAEVMCFKNL